MSMRRLQSDCAQITIGNGATVLSRATNRKLWHPPVRPDDKRPDPPRKGTTVDVIQAKLGGAGPIRRRATPGELEMIVVTLYHPIATSFGTGTGTSTSLGAMFRTILEKWSLFVH
jgi:hypothetical protein